MATPLRDSDTDRIRGLLDAVDDSIVLLDDLGHIELWPGSAEQMFGHASVEIEGKHAAMLFSTPPPLAAPDLKRLSAEGWHIRKDGTRFWGEAVLRPIARKGGRPRGSALTIHDLSSRRAADEATLAHTIDLERSNRELDEFAALASHDLQEPVRKIRAFAERLRMRLGASLDETSADYMSRMDASAARMQRLLEDLLEYSRLATRQEPFTRVALGEIASQALADLESKNAVIEIETLPTVDGSAPQLRRLFQNLIANAFKFHKPGMPPVLRITGRSVPPAAGRARVWAISFADEGIGFDEKHVERIFGMFQRLHERSAYEGTGMGLAICRRIAARHGGGITARSTPGKGTTFVVTLPEISTTQGATA